MKLINTQTNKIEDVQDFETRLFEGSHGLISGENYKLINEDNEVVNVGADVASKMFQDGSSFADDEDEYQQQLSEVENSLAEQGKAAAESALEGVTAGISTGVLTKAGIIDPDSYFLRKKAFPITTTAFDIAGSLALGGGLGALAKGGAKLVIKHGAKQAVKKVSGKAAKYSGLAALESGARGLGDYYSETELYDDDFNAESAIARTAVPALVGGTIGLVAGKVIGRKPKKIKEVLNKHGAILEGDDAFKDIGIDSLGMTRRDKTLGLKGVNIQVDSDGNLYNQMGKSRIAINPEFGMEANLLDMTSKKELNTLGEKFGVRDLYSEIYEDSDLGEALAGGAVRVTDIINDVKTSQMDSELLGDLGVITDELKVGRLAERRSIVNELGKSTAIGSRLRKEMIRNPEDKYLKSALSNNVKRSNRAFKRLKGLEKKKLTSNRYSEAIDYYNAQKKELSQVLDNEFDAIDGFKLKDRVFVTRPQVLDKHINAIVRDTVEDTGKKSTKHLLRAIGFNKTAFRKYGDVKKDEIADMVYQLRGKQADRTLTTRLREVGQTPLDSKYIDKNIEIMKNNSLFGIDNSLNRIQNNLPETKVVDRKLTGASIRKIILKSARKEMTDPDTGNIDSIFTGSWEKINKFADGVRDQRFVDGVDEPFTLNSLRRFKTNLGAKIKTWETNDQGIDKAVLKDIYFELNNHIEKLARSNGLGKIADELKVHNKNYHLSTIIEKSIKAKLAGEAARGGAGLGSFMSGVMTSASASSLGFAPAFMLGKIATVSRDFMKSHGDEIMANFYRQQELANISTQKAIKKSSIGFVKNFNTRIGTSAFTSQIDKDSVQSIYESDKKQLEEAIQDPADLLDRFMDNNKQMSALLPEVSNSMFDKVNMAIEFLAEKLPTSNNDDGLDFDYVPSDREIRKYHRYRNAALNPMKVIKDAENGYISPEGKEVLQAIYPNLYKSFLRHLSVTVSSGKVSRIEKRKILRFIGSSSDTLKENGNRQLLMQLRNKEVQEQEQQKQGVTAPTESMQKKKYGNSLTQAQRLQER